MGGWGRAGGGRGGEVRGGGPYRSWKLEVVENVERAAPSVLMIKGARKPTTKMIDAAREGNMRSSTGRRERKMGMKGRKES